MIAGDYSCHKICNFLHVAVGIFNEIHYSVTYKKSQLAANDYLCLSFVTHTQDSWKQVSSFKNEGFMSWV